MVTPAAGAYAKQQIIPGSGIHRFLTDLRATLDPKVRGVFDLLDAQVTLANFAPRFRGSGSQWHALVLPGVKPRRRGQTPAPEPPASSA